MFDCTQHPLPERPIPFVQDHAEILTEWNKKRLANDYQKLLEELDTHLQVTTLLESPPYFFCKSPKGGMSNFASMAGLIGFDLKNHWFLRNLDHDYIFSFQNITFEKTKLTSPEKPLKNKSFQILSESRIRLDLGYCSC